MGDTFDVTPEQMAEYAVKYVLWAPVVAVLR